jgi:serine/threonine protein kinase
MINLDATFLVSPRFQSKNSAQQIKKGFSWASENTPKTTPRPYISHASKGPSPVGSRTPKSPLSLKRFEKASSMTSGPNTFVTAEKALQTWTRRLSMLERKEINRYKKIYFIGSKFKKMLDCYTNKTGDYICNVGDHIAYRYEIIKVIDSGSFSTVVECVDHKWKQEVAVKVMKKSHTSKSQAKSEYKMLKLISDTNPDCSSVIESKRMFEFRFHTFLVFELLSLNLYGFIKEKNFAPISPGIVKRITVQLLTGLAQVHELNIIHSDLKPENILFKNKNKSSIRIIDFGSSCFVGQTVHSYVQSRYYRAPEIILQCGYNEAIDMWSLGCIITEMLIGEPLFQGENEIEMLEMIINVLGMPPDELVLKSKVKSMLDRSFSPKTNPISAILAGTSSDIINFVESCLKWEPEKRITAKEGLKCQWIRGLHVDHFIESLDKP